MPVDTPYALLVESDVEVVCQYSRLDTAQSEMALMTTIAY
ncbi:sensory rhodopsin transducer [Gemmiger formicilis]|nr:sensory rhodopsin transducer [Gemmiger formicilis]